MAPPKGQSLVGPEAVTHLLRDLLGKPVVVAKGQPVPPKGAIVALYGDGAGKTTGIIVCDLALAASAGAALALIPAAVAQESVRAGKLAENLAENLHEVLNIGARLFPAHPGVRVALGEVFLPPAAPGADVVAQIAKPSARVDFAVTIPGYAAGKMSVLALNHGS